MSANTVTEHFEDIKSIEQLMKDGSALLRKVQAELAETRKTLEILKHCQHPKVLVEVGYRSSISDEKTMSPERLIQLQVERINGLLGDRA